MEIKIGEPISHELAKILRSRITDDEKEAFAKEWGVHVNTVKNRMRMKGRSNINTKNDVKMIVELCGIAFKNNNNVIYRAKCYKAELEKVVI